jgi:hypothetical protein
MVTDRLDTAVAIEALTGILHAMFERANVQ